ncbi:MAG TPA: hypothetical protein VM491_05320 [Burkholderiaceae bacterium]|nr:hypothetical protein [Burkholderiaceae bacterium]
MKATDKTMEQAAAALKSQSELSMELLSAVADNMKRMVDLNVKLAQMAVRLGLDGYADASERGRAAPPDPTKAMRQFGEMYSEVSKAMMDMTAKTQAAMAKATTAFPAGDANRMMSEWQAAMTKAAGDMMKYASAGAASAGAAAQGAADKAKTGASRR